MAGSSSRPITIDQLKCIGSASRQAMAVQGKRLIERTREAIPFEHILVTGLDLEGFRVGTGTILASSFPADYLTTYYREGHLRHDPLFAMTLSAGRTVSDDEAWARQRRGDRLQGLRKLLRTHGIRHRTAVPLGSAGRLYGSVVVTGKRSLTEGEVEYLQFVAEPLHRVFSRPYADEVAARVGLTQGERLCLQLASHGFTSEGIADESGYAFETVNSYLKSAARKLGTANRSQAIAEAIRRRLIE